MATRSTDTMQEWLQRIIQDIAQAKTLGDADLAWLTQFETMALQKIREPIEAMKQPGGVLAGPSAPPSGPQGMPAGQGMGGGMMAGAQMPNPDELQRLLNTGP